jgi:DNA-directed RNA polymerase subunit RPC12/RpoP
MYDIRLDDGTINCDGEWLSVEDLTQMIQEKIQAGEMKFAKVAGALEELNKALENSVAIETKLVLTKQEYEKLKSLGGEDDRECVRQAIAAFISGGAEAESPAEPEDASDGLDEKSNDKKKAIVKCTKCKTPIEITTDERPVEIKCPNCGASGRLKA